ncbi:hypothetical protein F4819DRAFT_439975 [Hypoxylon fuscum]|nr:hypothetical protein F4819DRAFT_439975 [Hypoxylon fuscum]
MTVVFPFVALEFICIFCIHAHKVTTKWLVTLCMPIAFLNTYISLRIDRCHQLVYFCVPIRCTLPILPIRATPLSRYQFL